jgi:hypothetical protein
MGSGLHQLPVVVPAFFVDACGYHGDARYVAVRWCEETNELWLSDQGHAMRGNPGPMTLLWRRPGGEAALERFRLECKELGRPSWMVVDRERHTLLLGKALDVFYLVSRQGGGVRV